MKSVTSFGNMLLYSIQIIAVCIIILSLFEKYSIADFLVNFSGVFFFFFVTIIAVALWRQGFKPAGFYILFACRYGGEEFSIILPYTNIDDSFQISERIRKNKGKT